MPIAPPRRKIIISLALFALVVVALVVYEIARPKGGIILKFPQKLYCLPTYINDSGEVKGFSASESYGGEYIFTWNPQEGLTLAPYEKDMGLPPPTTSNSKGQRIGIISENGKNYAAIIQKNEKMHKLPLLGGDYSSAQSINNKGQVVGFISHEPPWWHDFWVQTVAKLGLPVEYLFFPRDYRYPEIVIWTVPPEEE
ncbi:MAG: hypothetical protein LBV12_05625 [Puniceicoccales bacterium]|jgi:hypothetical protein|nr:hypothetical protein [Puniceicoccales bacterium]